MRNHNYTPMRWTEFFDSQHEVIINQGTFIVYQKGISGPVIVTLHGGGYSALSWSVFAKEIIDVVECRVLSIDLRGHGSTTTTDDNDLSLQTLTADVHSVLNKLFDEKMPPIVMMGHSMGAAVAVEIALTFKSTIGLIVVDLVEGIALESLCSMQKILNSRPKGFESIEDAVRWSVHKGVTFNVIAARISMPGQIVNLKTKELASSEVMKNGFQSNSKITIQSNNIPEEDESSIEDCKAVDEDKECRKFPYEWRINLSETEKYWKGWFEGLSQKFLSVSAHKILLLANIQELDKPLTIAHMQGKFQCHILNRSGHAIHEDKPQEVAKIIAEFLVRWKYVNNVA